MSYPLYLLHDIFGVGVIRTLVTAGIQQYVALFLTVSIILVICLLVTVYAEPAVRSFLGRYWPLSAEV
jgi:peptidoglycan/LPS O-acetylase OafA/YrhL